jgi:hypothetical protein
LAALPLTPWFKGRAPLPPAQADQPTKASDPDDYSEIYAAVAALAPKSGVRCGTGEPVTATFQGGAGIEEADLVKTDGESLFVASGNQVAIVEVDGAGSRTVGIVRLEEALRAAPALRDAPDVVLAELGAVDLLADKDTLVVLVSWSVLDYGLAYEVWDGQDWAAAEAWDPVTLAVLYDVSDPAAPRHLETFSQSGGYAGAYLKDGALFLLSGHSVGLGREIAQGDPASFVPVIGETSGSSPVPAGQVLVGSNPSSPTYALITAVDLAARKRLSSLSALGVGPAHVSENSLCLAAAVAHDDGTTTTDVWRVPLDADRLAVAARGSLPGWLGRAALDEHDGYLRALTSEWIPDELVNGLWTGHVEDGLTVLDSALSQVGEVRPLGGPPAVSARVTFAGDLAYVTAEGEADSLFAVDLSDPTRPRVLSALDTDGYVPSLRPLADQGLLGVGWLTDESQLTAEGKFPRLPKLSLFQGAGQIAETATLELDGLDSVDDDALVADPARRALGLPADAVQGPAYLVAGYGSGRLTELARLDAVRGRAGSSLSYPVRGVFLGGSVYVCSRGGVAVYSLDSFAELARITF